MTNRLADETSPYLLQHKDNPVDWYPWGEEALERAREQDRPILLSIGYSSCHWCHVMERESFEDPEVAALMNRQFVNVKVDREERPDLDSVYMTAVQSMTGQGGWPLTVFLTPDGVPYYGGTYFPPEPRQGMPSFRQVLDAAASAYGDRPDEVREAADKLVGVLKRATTARAPDRAPDEATPGRPTEEESASARLGRIGPKLLDEAVRSAASRFDERNGGFGQAPKFPQPPVLDFLLRRGADGAADAEGASAGTEAAGGTTDDGDGPDVGPAPGSTNLSEEALRIVTRTLESMARGGIRDHLAGGFHRYTVDAKWLVPHFEKMLYDNALLARVYLHHHLATGEEESRNVAVETLDWLLDDMRSEEGGFYSARDADSEGEEGRYYVWTADEVDEVLDPDDAELFRRAYDVTPEGNWEGKSILHLPRELDALAEEHNASRAELDDRLNRCREELLARRRRRDPPLRDEKVLVGWNGLLLRTLAEAGPALERPDYTRAAEDGASFILEKMRDDDRLLHTWKDGRARIPGFLEDYAALGNALLTLHEGTLDPRWRSEAVWCSRKIVELFWDRESELFFDTAFDGEELVVRPRDAMDNPSPSGTSLAVELLLRVAVVLDDASLRDIAVTALTRDLETVRRHPTAFGALLGALDFFLSRPVEVAVVGPETAEETQEMLRVVHARYLPRKVVVGADPDAADGTAADERTGKAIPLLRGRGMRDGQTTVYVCRDYACREPVTAAKEVERLLDER